jgi:hypothetical protein
MRQAGCKPGAVPEKKVANGIKMIKFSNTQKIRDLTIPPTNGIMARPLVGLDLKDRSSGLQSEVRRHDTERNDRTAGPSINRTA